MRDFHRFLDALEIVFALGADDFVRVPIAGLGEANAFGRDHVHALTELGFDAVEQGDDVLGNVRIAAQLDASRVRADDGQCFQAIGTQRQDAIVLQQHDGLAGGFERQRARLGVAGDLFGVLGVRIRLFEQAGEKLQAQHVGDRSVDVRLLDATFGERLRQQREALAVRQIGRDAGFQCTDSGMRSDRSWCDERR